MENSADSPKIQKARARSLDSFSIDDIISRLSIDMPQQQQPGMAEIGNDGFNCLSPIAPQRTPSPQILQSSNSGNEIGGKPRIENERGRNDTGDQIVPLSSFYQSISGDENLPPGSTKENQLTPESNGRKACDIEDTMSLSEDSPGQRRDMEAVRNLIGVSSRVFMEHLRGAAFRRKADLARSRDSLVAKEKELLKAIAASKESAMRNKIDGDFSRNIDEGRSKSPFSSKARSVACNSRASGVAGVPKVDKRPSTIPRSPLIGKRRSVLTGAHVKDRAKQQVQVLHYGETKKKVPPLPEDSKSKISEKTDVHSRKSQTTRTSDTLIFKARPLPKTTGDFGHGGLAGVTKVPKRQVTVPVSPLLGLRRSKTQSIDSPSTACKTNNEFSPFQHSSSGLIGVNLISSSSETSPPIKTPPRSARVTEGFVLHSTLRAQKRAEFEISRRIHELEREREESLRRKNEVVALEKELSFLRGQI